MSNIKIHALKAFTMRDSSTGKLTSIAHGAIADVDSTVGGQLITDGLAEAYTLITPTGKKTITENGTNIDVAQYEKADVAVPLPTGKIEITENGTDIDVSSYASADVNVSGGSSDFSTAEITIINNSGSAVTLGDIVSTTFQVTSDFRVVNLDTEIANNGTLVLDLLTPINLGVGWIAGVFQEVATCVVSNMVNCTVDDGNIFITDPSKDSSCTVTAS